MAQVHAGECHECCTPRMNTVEGCVESPATRGRQGGGVRGRVLCAAAFVCAQRRTGAKRGAEWRGKPSHPSGVVVWQVGGGGGVQREKNCQA